ncbi:MAG: SH3 domain-containing protein [Minicystis sp.]
MSDTKPTAASSPDGSAPAPAARWIERLSSVLLVAAGGIALASAAPALLRTAGAPLPEAEPIDGAPPLDLRRQPPELLADPDPLFDPDHDADGDDLPTPLAGGHARLGFARGALALRASPGEGGRSVGEVKAGELVMIVRESGDWALVWAGGADNFMKGWARKSGIAVR